MTIKNISEKLKKIVFFYIGIFGWSHRYNDSQSDERLLDGQTSSWDWT